MKFITVHTYYGETELHVAIDKIAAVGSDDGRAYIRLVCDEAGSFVDEDVPQIMKLIRDASQTS